MPHGTQPRFHGDSCLSGAVDMDLQHSPRATVGPSEHGVLMVQT